MKNIIYSTLIIFSVVGCISKTTSEKFIAPKEIIDLGALVTEDLPERVWGAFMDRNRFKDNNSFDIIKWEYDFPDGKVSGSNSYYRLFNHGGPHVDAPNHVNLDGGIDSYPLEAFVGPVKVIDVSNFSFGRSVPIEVIKRHNINPGDIVLIYTAYKLPDLDARPQRIALTQDAAEYLATLPVRAFGTDAYNVESDDNDSPVKSESALERMAPIHFSFLSRGIPIFEQLFNVEKLVGKQKMYFVGPPLNIKDGDGMMVRPVVLVYE
jgi:kynurenine formamidase